MNKSNKFSPEVRERAVRMVQEHLALAGGGIDRAQDRLCSPNAVDLGQAQRDRRRRA